MERDLFPEKRGFFTWDCGVLLMIDTELSVCSFDIFLSWVVSILFFAFENTGAAIAGESQIRERKWGRQLLYFGGQFFSFRNKKEKKRQSSRFFRWGWLLIIGLGKQLSSQRERTRQALQESNINGEVREQSFWLCVIMTITL